MPTSPDINRKVNLEQVYKYTILYLSQNVFRCSMAYVADQIFLKYIYPQNDFINALRSFTFCSQNGNILKVLRLFSTLFSQIVLEMVILVFRRSKCHKLTFLKILSLELVHFLLLTTNLTVLFAYCCHKVHFAKKAVK